MMVKLSYKEKVEIFVQELTKAETLRGALIAANERGVNSAFYEDEEAFHQALKIAGNPDKRKH